MRQLPAVPVLLAIFSLVTACPDSDHDSRLEDAIKQYVNQREAEVQALCKCYHLFLNLSQFDSEFNYDFFASEEECLETLGPAPEEEVVNCMRSVLGASAYATKDGADVVICYTEVMAKQTDCYTQNAEECSQTACLSDSIGADQCQGKLTDAEVKLLWHCAAR